MYFEKTPFGGLLLHTSHGNFAVNAGGSMEAMEIHYRLREQPLRGLILTSEHEHRSGNVAAFADRFGIPVLVSPAVAEVLGERLAHPVLLSPPGTAVFEGLSVEFHCIQDDSIDPVYLIVRDQEKTLGIVPDGRLSERTAEPLRHCITVCLARRPPLVPGFPSALNCRLQSTANTDEEIARLFPDTVPVLL
ncbi:MAG: hypothetical protein IJS14_08145 [Lentisphaeria bacterium]|nr:hypothetical protein [Lentisphaeria bacterium]